MLINEQLIKNLSLAMAILGIISLFLISSYVEPREVALGDITSELVGYKIKARGYVKDFYWHDGHFFATLSENRDEIKLVIFERDARKFPLLNNATKSSLLTVIGTVNEYENELEIVGKDVKLE